MGLGSGMLDPRSGIRKKPIPDPGSRGQKGTGSRIRNTAFHTANKDTFDIIILDRRMILTVFSGVGQVEMNGIVGPASAPVLHDIFAVVQRLLPVAVRRAVRLPHSLLLPVTVQPEQIILRYRPA